jgi:C-terminal processing protease CtpA/Prc
MKKYILTVLISVLTIISSNCQTQSNSKFNLDFETVSNPTQLPDGWGRWGTPSYSISIDSVTKQSGKYSLRIESQTDNIVQGEFGCPRYSVPAIYAGNTVTVKAVMKLEEVENPIGLLLRIDGNSGTLQFDNMQQMGIKGTLDWKEYSVRLPLPKEAQTIHIGAIHSGKGKLWIDNFQLLIDGKDISEAQIVEKPKLPADEDIAFANGSNITFPVLNESKIRDLELLGKLWGFLKYHHPEVGKGNYNWDNELFRLFPAYLKTENTNERDQVLIDWINKYGAISICNTCKETPTDAYLKPNLLWVESSNMNSDLKKRIQDVYTNRHQGEHYYIKMAPGVGNPDFSNEKPYANMTYPDAGFRLLALYRYWNMIHYFFPNTYLTDKKWDDVLKEYIPIFLSAKNELEYELAAIKIIGDINDTHAFLAGGRNAIQTLRGNNFSSFRVQFVEQKLVVTDYYNPELKEASGLEIGDIITHINGQTIESIIDSVKIYYPASNEAVRLWNISFDLLRSNNNTISIRYISSGQMKQKELPLYQRNSLNIYRYKINQNEKSYKLLDGNIGYVTLATIKSEDISVIKELFRNTRGIIIDIRNYPSTFVPFLLGSYFVSNSAPFVKFTNGNVNNPGEFTFTPVLEIPKADVTYKGKLVVIVNESSISQSEYTAMAFRAGNNTTIVGSQTAGADGNVSRIILPGGLQSSISGIGVYYPDGTKTQRIGIVPDVKVEPTINGIKQGKDEVLDKAIEIIEKK